MTITLLIPRISFLRAAAKRTWNATDSLIICSFKDNFLYPSFLLLCKMKKALITGVTGQDGSYLAELLLKKGYKVLGIQRRSSVFNTERIDHIYESENFDTVYGDLTDGSNINRVIRKFEPDEIYNLGAQSHVKVSFEVPEYTTDTDALGTLRLLEALRDNKKDIKLYQGSSSEMFGKVRGTPQNENTPFYPRSPYACAKVFAYWITVNYREA